MLIGAYRDNEVNATHPLMRKLEPSRPPVERSRDHAGAARPSDLGQLIADALRCESERAAPLAHLVHEKTDGNPFFAIQFMSALAKEGMLTFDHDAARWSWDLDRIHAKGYTDNVVDLMVGKLTACRPKRRRRCSSWRASETSPRSRTVGRLRDFGGAGPRGSVAGRPPGVGREPGGRLPVRPRSRAGSRLFVDPGGATGQAHLRIGRLLAAHTPPEKREEAIFDTVNQLNRGAALITSRDEREQLAELNLIAGKRAKASTAYASALAYLAAGVALLAGTVGSAGTQLTFALALQRAECEFLTGKLAAAEARLTTLASRAVDTVDQATVACLRVDLYTTLDRNDRAVDVGLDYLRHVGIEWSPHPTEEDARREYERIWALLGSRDDRGAH